MAHRSISFFSPIIAYSQITQKDLIPYKKILPPTLILEDILDWNIEFSEKNFSISFDVNTYTLSLKEKSKEILKNKNKVRFRIAGEVLLSKNKKRAKRYYFGFAHIYIYSTGKHPELVNKKRIKLAKLCPS